MEDLRLHFGDAEVIANSYQFSMEEAEVRQKVKQKKILLYLFASGILVVFVVSLVLVGVYTKKATDELPEYYVFNEHPAGEISSIPAESLNNSNTVTI